MDTQTKQIIESYIHYFKESHVGNDINVGKLYVSLALEIYQHGCNEPNKEILNVLKDNSLEGPKILDDDNLSYLVEHKQEAIDYICDCQQHPLLTGSWLYMTPVAISTLCVHLAKVKEGSRVYLPFLGLGSFADNLPKDCVIEGEEYDEDVWALEKIREWSRGVDYTGLVRGDSYLHMEYPANVGKYDTIIMAPPYGSSRKSKWRDDIAEALDKSLALMSDNGRIVMFAPNYINIAIAFERLRARLLREGMVEIIINLQEGLLLPVTGIPACIWVITKAKNQNVTFIDANGSVLPRKDNNFLSLDADTVLSIVNSEYSEAKVIVDSNQVDPKFVMPEKTKSAYIQRNNNLATQVLYIDDDTDVSSFVELAKNKGVQITHYESWDEGEDDFRQRLQAWDAIILDANCKFHANDTLFNVNTFLGAAISRIERICFQNRVDTIPWYVLTKANEDTTRCISDILTNFDRPWNNDKENPSYYLKGYEDELIKKIVGQKNCSLDYKIKLKYFDLFLAIEQCGLIGSVGKYMKNLLCPMYDGTNDTDYNHRFNDARKTLEAIFTDMIKRGYLPDSLRTNDKKGANLTYCSLILAGEEKEINNSDLKEKGITKANCKGYGALSKLMAYNVKSIIYAAGSNEHDQQIISNDGKKTVNTELYLNDVNKTSYLIQSYALQLCDIIFWYRNFITKSNNYGDKRKRHKSY